MFHFRKFMRIVGSSKKPSAKKAAGRSLVYLSTEGGGVEGWIDILLLWSPKPLSPSPLPPPPSILKLSKIDTETIFSWSVPYSSSSQGSSCRSHERNDGENKKWQSSLETSKDCKYRTFRVEPFDPFLGGMGAFLGAGIFLCPTASNNFFVSNTSRNFFCEMQHFPPLEYGVGYFFRSPVAAGLFLRELGLQGIFFKKAHPRPQRSTGWPLSWFS